MIDDAVDGAVLGPPRDTDGIDPPPPRDLVADPDRHAGEKRQAGRARPAVEIDDRVKPVAAQTPDKSQEGGRPLTAFDDDGLVERGCPSTRRAKGASTT